jgi:thiamine-phosphate pyrophosphorylase
VIANDRLDIALAAGASGLHVGQEDLPLDAVRALAPDGLLVGVSTHSVEEVRRAAAGGAAYVGFGPMFPTGSKADAHPTRSLDALRTVRAAVSIPIVAIGGITEARARAVLDAGADAVAMIAALATSADPRGLVARLVAGAR